MSRRPRDLRAGRRRNCDKKGQPPPPHWRRDPGAVDRSLREELSELVEADPETAANILRNWIGQMS